MSKGLVLITGINGYIAASTAAHILSEGYSVRGTVRRLEAAQPLLEGPFKDYASSGRCSIVQVPDITIDGAFDEAVKDVTAILHLAAPVSLHLEISSSSWPQLKTVVLASSIAATRVQVDPPYTFTEKDFNTWAEPTVAKQKKKSLGPLIYIASKAAAERVFWEFKKKYSPRFTMTSINPVFVIGPPLMPPKNVSEVPKTTTQIWTIFSGNPHPVVNAMSPYVVDVRDVAKLFLYPIVHNKETDGERFIASSAASHLQAYADILRNAFPEAKDRIIEGTRGVGYREDYTLSEVELRVDGSKAAKAIGGCIDLRKSVVDTAKSFEGLL